MPQKTDVMSVEWHVIVKFSGDYGGGDTPLPFPNRVVKPASADGTVPMSGMGE